MICTHYKTRVKIFIYFEELVSFEVDICIEGLGSVFYFPHLPPAHACLDTQNAYFKKFQCSFYIEHASVSEV